MALAKAPDMRRHTALHPWVTNEVHAILTSEAERRGQPVDRFAASLLETIAQAIAANKITDADLNDVAARQR